MPTGAYAKLDRSPITEDDWRKPILDKEDARNAEILEQLKIGGSEEYNKSISLFPIGLIPSPVRVPTWMFRKFPEHPQFNLDDIEKVAMAHVIHFTNCANNTGYIECSGHIENWCKCSVEEAHNALQRLVDRKLIISHVLDPRDCKDHKRNLGYFVNIPYVHAVLQMYRTDIWL